MCCVKHSYGKTNPATKIFQALRIYVNDELGSLENLLGSLKNILDTGARAVFLSYHSLEDRIIKQAFKSFGSLKVINKKVIIATPEEIKNNPRSRSAKLRTAEKL